MSTTAPAKINLTLEIVGRLADGRHALASLIVFADFGDTLHYEDAPAQQKKWELHVKGAFARDAGAPENNLVTRAATLLAKELNIQPRGTMTLEKNLPVAAGLGGGSSDAARALRLLAQAWDAHCPEAKLFALAKTLGADVPACLHARPCFVSGWGERVRPLELPPNLALLVLVPPLPLATSIIYDAYRAKYPNLAPPPDNTPDIPPLPTQAALATYLQAHTNALAPLAQERAPLVSELLARLKKTNPLAAGMSGSGPACFALYATNAERDAAHAAFLKSHKKIWIKKGRANTA